MPEDRVCQGYRVIDSIRVDNVEVVLAHNPKAVEKYVTWMCYNLEKPLDFDVGCYFADEASARKNMQKRADGLREFLPPLHPDKKPRPVQKPPVHKKPHGKAR